MVMPAWVLPPARPPLFVRVGVAGALVLLVAYALSTLLRTDTRRLLFFDLGIFAAIAFVCAAVVLARAVLVSTERLSWTFIGAGMIGSGLGDIAFSLWGTGSGGSTWVGALFYLMFYPLAYAGTLLLHETRLLRLPARIWLDSTAALLAFGAVAAAVLIRLIGNAPFRDSAEVIISGAYLVWGFMLLGVCAAAFALHGWKADRRWVLLSTGWGAFVVADGTYAVRTAQGVYIEGTLLDVLWPAAFVLCAVASWTPFRKVSDHRPSDVVPMAVLRISAIVAVLVIAFEAVVDRNLIPIVIAGVSLAIITVRIARTFSELRVHERGLRRQLEDELTGLANLQALKIELADITAPALPAAEPGARTEVNGLVLVGIKDFKEVTRTFGPLVGEELLRQVAVRVTDTAGHRQLVARVGECEFAVLFQGDEEAAKRLSANLHRALRPSFALVEMALRVEASVGYALYPQHCDDPRDLPGKAAWALQVAESAVTRTASYDSAPDPYGPVEEKLVEELKVALRRGELTCYYQPKVDCQRIELHSVEALVRWRHPERGVLAPAQFLPAAERAGLMRPLTLAVLHVALSQARQWSQAGMRLPMAVNLSVTNLLDADLVSDIAALLDAHSVPSSDLIIEITEDVLVTDAQRAQSVVESLQQLGVGLAIDDFGTGWSSLACLQNLAADELKLDRSFISRITTDPRSDVIVRSTVALAHALGMRMVAEGVEDEPTFRALREYGCDVTQGYFHSPPLPAREFALWVRAFTGHSLRGPVGGKRQPSSPGLSLGVVAPPSLP